MTAVERRRLLAAIGNDLSARCGGPAERRGASLLRSISGERGVPVTIGDIALVPGWLRLPHAAQRRIARLAALVSIAPHLAMSIDGGWLGGMATAAGEAAVDWAIAQQVAADMVLSPVDGDHLAARGAALLRASLPPTLRDLVEGSADEEIACEIAAACVARALTAPDAV